MLANHNDSARLLRRTCLFSVMLCLLVVIAAAYALRGLFADGSFYLLNIMASEIFAFMEPSRITAHAIQQWLTVCLLKTGLSDTLWLARVFTFSMLASPLLFIGLSYFLLPRDLKCLFLFPLFYYLAGTMSSSFLALGEAQIAGSYFWFVLFLILFVEYNHLTRAFTILAALLTLAMHEAYAFLGPLLMIACFYRFRKALNNSDRVFFIVLSLTFLCATVAAFYFTLLPRSEENRGFFISDMIHLRFLLHGFKVNIPAVLGILVAIGIFCGATTRIPRFRSVILISTSLAALFAAFAPLLSERTLSPAAQFSARNYGALLIPVLCLLCAAAMSKPAIRSICRARFTLAMIFVLAVGQSGWHLSATLQWQRYVDVFREILDENHGLISFAEAIQGYAPETRRNINNMTWVWTSPTMSLLLAKDGNVQTIVANPERNTWQPFDPRAPGWLANERYFNLGAYFSSLHAAPPGSAE